MSLFCLEDDNNTKSPLYAPATEIHEHYKSINTVRLLVLSNSTINKYDIKNQRIIGKNSYADVWDLKKIYAKL